MQTNKTFSISEALNYGWETFKKQPMFWIVVLLIMIAVSIGLNLFQGIVATLFGVSDSKEVTSADFIPSMIVFITSIIVAVISMGVQLGSIRIDLDAIENKVLAYSTLFSQFHPTKLLKYFVASIIFGFMVGIGLLLFVVPGLYWGIKYQFFTYFIVEKDAGIFESFKLSAEATKDVKTQLLGLSLIMFFILILGALVFGVGLFIAVPVVSLAYVYVYKKLQSFESQPAVSAAPVVAPSEPAAMPTMNTAPMEPTASLSA
jgi:uncharacterized membrane protein